MVEYLSQLGFADDLVLSSESEECLKMFYKDLRRKSLVAGLKISINKSQVMLISQAVRQPFRQGN